MYTTTAYKHRGQALECERDIASFNMQQCVHCARVTEVELGKTWAEPSACRQYIVMSTHVTHWNRKKIVLKVQSEVPTRNCTKNGRKVLHVRYQDIAVHETGESDPCMMG